jgi:hypothetical protein
MIPDDDDAIREAAEEGFEDEEWQDALREAAEEDRTRDELQDAIDDVARSDYLEAFDEELRGAVQEAAEEWIREPGADPGAGGGDECRSDP